MCQISAYPEAGGVPNFGIVWLQISRGFGGLTEGRGSGKDSKREGLGGSLGEDMRGIIIPGIPGHH